MIQYSPPLSLSLFVLARYRFRDQRAPSSFLLTRHIHALHTHTHAQLPFSQAYNWLRKSANLILNLLSLMSDAGISELSADPVAVLAKVEERFRLDLTDEMVSQPPSLEKARALAKPTRSWVHSRGATLVRR